MAVRLIDDKAAFLAEDSCARQGDDLIQTMLHKMIVAAAWGMLVFIAVATLSPLELRPEIGDANLERFVAYAFAGLLIALAYPRYFILVVLFVVGAAVALESLQLVTPDRDAEFADAVIKAAGGLLGVVVAFVVLRFARANDDG
jgi:VanZ family protein